jgi:hypothetical protein
MADAFPTNVGRRLRFRACAICEKVCIMRIALACLLLGALIGAGLALRQERDYTARAFVIRVPPLDGGESVLALARSDAVIRSAVELSEVGARGGPSWLREHSAAELTGRLDLALSVSAPEEELAAGLATAYAKAVKRALPIEPGLNTVGRGARRAERERGPLAWGLIGAAVGLWAGAALGIVVRRGSARAARRA